MHDVDGYVQSTRELLSEVDNEPAVAAMMILGYIRGEWPQEYAQMVATLALVRLAVKP
jgi:hypothetical protein